MDTFLFLFYILNVINFSLEYYDMKFGHIFMNYYQTSDCSGNFNQITYSIEDDDKLYFLNNASNIIGYPYSFDFFSTTVYYSRTEDEEEDDEEKDDTREDFYVMVFVIVEKKVLIFCNPLRQNLLPIMKQRIKGINIIHVYLII